MLLFLDGLLLGSLIYLFFFYLFFCKALMYHCDVLLGDAVTDRIIQRFSRRTAQIIYACLIFGLDLLLLFLLCLAAVSGLYLWIDLPGRFGFESSFACSVQTRHGTLQHCAKTGVWIGIASALVLCGYLHRNAGTWRPKRLRKHCDRN